MITCPSCGAQNPTGARFCVRCGASLIPACGRCGAELPEGARFCPACGAPAAEPEPLPAGRERRLVTVLFADVTGSTALGERLDPERLQEVLETYFSAMRQEIEAEGGTVEKFIGDAIMAAFGVPAVHEDDPSRALRAALRMLRRLGIVNDQLQRGHGITLQIRIGVNTGEVLAATTPQPGEAMATGDAVNVAARLQQAAEPGQVVTSERTARAARGFRYQELGPLDLRGKAEPVAALVLLEEKAGGVRGIPGLAAPMVGRDQELALLRSIFDRVAVEGRPDLVTIYGDAGVGKSRLVAEFLRWAEAVERPPIAVRGRCLPYGEGVTYWPLAEILKSRGGVQDNDAPDVALERIHRLRDELLTPVVATNPARAAAALAYTVGIDDPEFSLRELEPRAVRQKIHGAWRSLFSGLAILAPVVVVVEDIHWADPALLDLLEELAERVQGSVMFVCPTRPELTERRPGWGGGRRNFSSISLEPLSSEEADRLVALLLNVEDLPVSVHRRILERAEGNPFFLEEIIRHLIDERRIVHEAGRWRAAADISEVQIPDTVQAVLAARIDLLDSRDKRTLQRAAVVGRVFWPGPVARLLNGDGAELEQALEALEERELVLSRLGSAIKGEPEFMFKHILTRDVAYESLPRRDLPLAHAEVAGWIEETAGERAGEFGELLAYHYEAAYRGALDDPTRDAELTERLRGKGFRTLIAASEEARSRFAVRKAAKLAERALSLAGSPVERAGALEQIGRVALSDYRGDLAWSSLREAADLLVHHAPAERSAIARVCGRAVEAPLRWPGSMRTIPPETDVRGYLDLGFANVEKTETEDHVRLLLARAFQPYAFGPNRAITHEEFEQAARDGTQAAEMALRLGRPDLASASLDGAASAYMSKGRYGDVVSFVRRRLELVEVLDDPWELGDIHATSAWALATMGNFPEARVLANEGASRTGHEAAGLMIHCLSWCCFAEFALGEWSAVVEDLFPRVQEALGDRRSEPPYFAGNALGSAALIYEARADPAAAEILALMERLLDIDRRQPPLQVVLWLAWVRARQGRLDEAWGRLEQPGSVMNLAARPFADQIRALVLAEAGRWDDVPAFLAGARAYSAEGALLALPVHLDRLEGRAALAAGDRARAIELLEKSSEGFERLLAPWEHACTTLSLAQAMLEAGRAQEAGPALTSALGVFQRLRSLREIDRANELLARLG